MSVILEANLYATKAHKSVNQKRKYTGEDYIVHPQAVARAVAEVAEEDTSGDHMIAAAWLHDVLEDTPTTEDQLRAIFPADVVELVKELTNSKDEGNRATRKQKELERTFGMSHRAKTVRLADVIDNTGSIVKYDPKFAKVYLAEKRLLLEALRGGDYTLWRRANIILNG